VLISRYHDQTKHHFHRFARSLGYLYWASQPDPFRRYGGAPTIELPREVLAGHVPYDALFDGSQRPTPMSDLSIGEFFRCSMGLSAWKQHGATRWALRVNPSSGNLHPTEAYLIRRGHVYHYAPHDHALEERCVFEPPESIADLGANRGADIAADLAAGHRAGAADSSFLVALTSIYWREAWKYGERAFRYCQHDTGHALGALRLGAALLGWRLALLPRWSDAQMSALLGLDRDADYEGAEREEPECLAIVTAGDTRHWLERDPAPLAEAAAHGAWRGVANQLSADHTAWVAIDEASVATRFPGRAPATARTWPESTRTGQIAEVRGHGALDARAVMLSRRSALGFDGHSSLGRAAFFSMLDRLRPPAPPWDAIDWPPHVHLVLFVHRVEGLVPGVYAYLRDEAVRAEWQHAMRSDFLWEPVSASNQHGPHAQGELGGLFLLVPIDCRHVASRLSCDQEIAADGYFSLAMVARMEPSLGERGEAFYRQLFWECGLIGQVLYLEAEAAGGRATGIGCFFDDAVHDTLGLTGHAWQSLYHFSMGLAVEDGRLTSEPGYPWEPGAAGA
jgi:SagB-type dehydrogenase family enzyme